ncbi:hypothetical protein SALBM217S_04875 [Streptomyces griseoloalbus]
MRQKARLALDASGPYGSLRGTPGKAIADDATDLYYEVDEVDPDNGPGSAPRKRRLFGRKAPRRSRSSSATATASPRTPGTSSARRCAACPYRSLGPAQPRTVGPGSPESGPDGLPVSIDRLGRDLKTVIDAAAPEGPLVLVGHSMGGMTIWRSPTRFPS